MNSYFSSGDVKVPTRPAPPPPKGGSMWSSSFGIRDKYVGKSSAPKKKNPPPRPPPPKFAPSRQPDVRGSQLVNSLFTQRSQSRPIYEPVVNLNANGCLIDWSSPPSSPTSTTRSSSDALSVNSFGSDILTPSSGSTSNVESGFEDDFELFGAPASRCIDPWSPPAQSIPLPKNNNNWVSFSPKPPKKVTMPTIIRPKPERPHPPKILEKKLQMNALEEIFQNFKVSKVEEKEEEEWSSDSPPMPSGPPPPLPPDVLSHIVNDSHVSDSSSKPLMAVALFDYVGAPGDLSFRQGDRVRIVRRVDENWYEASLQGRQGTAPANFLQMENADPSVVRALYAFSPETWEDLELQPGCEVRLLGRVNDDWLYGEVGSRRGQFPATFVDHVPAHLPPWSL